MPERFVKVIRQGNELFVDHLGPDEHAIDIENDRDGDVVVTLGPAKEHTKAEKDKAEKEGKAELAKAKKDDDRPANVEPEETAVTPVPVDSETRKDEGKARTAARAKSKAAHPARKRSAAKKRTTAKKPTTAKK